MTSLIKSGFVASTLLILATGGVYAQSTWMDIDPGIVRTPYGNEFKSDELVNPYVWEYYRELQKRRSNGYTGPALPNGRQRSNCSTEYDDRTGRYYVECK